MQLDIKKPAVPPHEKLTPYAQTEKITLQAGLRPPPPSPLDPPEPMTPQKWAQQTLEALEDRAPTAVAVTLRLMQMGGDVDIATSFRRDFALASAFMRHPDFAEGVEARLVRRDKARPRWRPAAFDEVSEHDVSAFFAAPPSSEGLKLLNADARDRYTSYPWPDLGLPSEQAVQQICQSEYVRDLGSVEQAVLAHWPYKPGVREKLAEIFARRAVDEHLLWDN